MTTLHLEDLERTLSCDRFELRDGLAEGWEATAVARLSADDAAAMGGAGRGGGAAWIGTRAELRLPSGSRRRGIVRRIEVHEGAHDGGGEPRVEVVLVAPTWLLGQGSRRRVFQRRTAVQIAIEVLASWGLAARARVDDARHPPLELRVQYDESDEAFLHRVLEEAGITWWVAEHEERVVVVLDDAPHQRDERRLRLVAADREGLARPAGGRPVASQVRVVEEIRPARALLRDVDFTLSADLDLAAEASAPGDARLGLEVFDVGAFSRDAGAREPGGVTDEALGRQRAATLLEAARAGRRVVRFHTDALDCRPGDRLAIEGHTLEAMADDGALLATHVVVSGATGQGERATVHAVFASEPYRPRRGTARPRVPGVEVARVVGPAHEVIHTDEHGRVRLRFPWDRREGGEASSCWARVSHAWAGADHGAAFVPRVGDEVLVEFFDGDPDRPVVVGRVFRGGATLPHGLPEQAARSVWRGATVPGGAGHNEIALDDRRGEELVYVHAARDREVVVAADDRTLVHGGRSATVEGDDATRVGAGRRAEVGSIDEVRVAERYRLTVAETAASAPARIDVTPDRIELGTSGARLVLEGSDARVEANRAHVVAEEIVITGRTRVRVAGGGDVIVESSAGDVVLQGGPMVLINPRDARAEVDDDLSPFPVPAPPGVDPVENVEAAEDHMHHDPARPTWLDDRLEPGGAWFFASDPAARDFHFAHEGAVARAAGRPRSVILRQAGLRRARADASAPAVDRGDPGNGLWGGRAPYGNDPRELTLLERGIDWYERNFGAGAGEVG